LIFKFAIIVLMGNMRSRPRVLLDVATHRVHSFARLNNRVNLSRSRFSRSYAGVFKKIILGLAALYLAFGSVTAPVWPAHLLAAQPTPEERQALEQQLVQLEGQIAEYESTIQLYKQQGKSLEGEISQLNAKIKKANLQVQAISLNLKNIDSEISQTKSQITLAEESLGTNKGALSATVRRLYENEQTSLVELFLKSMKLSDFFANLNNLLEVQDNLTLTINKISDLREDLLDKKEILALKRSDIAELKAYQAAQQAALASAKKEKDNLLSVTKGQETKYQAILKETRKTAAQIRSRIFEFLGGGEMTFEKAYEFARFAEDSTGVRAALILAVLDRESALGQNVGRCSYETAMHPTRDVPVFLALLQELGISANSVNVSCANADGAYGGAMGPAQFIPSTWVLFKDKVGEITGSKPASPWRNGDAFVATGLYLKNSMKGCDAIYSKKLDVERCAAAKYYAGSRWRRHLWGYGDRVVTRAQQFQVDIDVINS